MIFVEYLQVFNTATQTMPPDAISFVLAAIVVLFFIWLIRGEL